MNYIYRGARLSRILILSVSLHQTGYHQGLVHYAQDPKSMEDQLVQSLVTSLGASKYQYKDSAEYATIKRVGVKIVRSAQLHCKDMIDNLEAQQKNLKDNNSKIEILRKKEKWTKSLNRINGNWDFIIVDIDGINAFVTPASPRKIFIYNGLMESLKPTDDELAMILSHEISHLILQHQESKFDIQQFMTVVTLVLISWVDPTGMYSLVYDYLVQKCGELITASFSRDCESEADELGVKIALNGCFNIQNGVHVFRKFPTFGDESKYSIFDSHPDVNARYRRLLEQVKKEDFQKALKSNARCRQYEFSFFK